MGAFDDFRRGFRTGVRGSSAAGIGGPTGPWTRAPAGNTARRDDAAAFNDGSPEFFGDDTAERNAVIAGLLEQNASLKEQVAAWAAAVAERDEYIGALADERDRACATRDRYQETGKRAAAQLRELEIIITFPGVKNALCKAVHPDTGTGGDIPSRTAVFQTLMAVLTRLGLGR